MADLLAVIIEDEEDLSVIFSEAMRAAGFVSEAIKRGDLAQERLKEIQPAVIILDLHLPGVDGGELLEQIRSDARLQNSMVVLTTADHAMADSLADQSDFVMLKPISFSQLRDLSLRLRQAIINKNG